MAPSIASSSTHYALVVDAGSSGSRLQIYSWRDPDLERAEILQEVARAQDGRGEPHRAWWWNSWIRNKWKGKGKEREQSMEKTALRRLVRVGKGVEGDAWVKRVEPGISTVSPEDIPAYLAPLLSHALQQIPPSQHASTPIYVLATAGMRLLTEEARTAILKATCDTLRQSYPFALDSQTCAENVRVISGEEEGMWGWVAVNYLMDGFGHAPDPSTSASSSSATNLLPLAPLAEAPPHSSKDSVTPVDVNHHSPTFGFLDMGGASTQLAFSPTPSELQRSGYPSSDLRKVSLRLLSGETVEWPVFVASWLDFGTNRVRDRYVDSLVSDWRKASGDGVLDLTTPISDPCLPKGLIAPSLDPDIHPGFSGTGSFSTCLTRLKPLLDHEHPCPAQHCLFGGVPTPHIDFERDDQRGFIGISEYWYTAQQVLGLGGVWDWGEWEKGMSGFCGRDWTDIETQVGKENDWVGAKVELTRLQMQCFKGAWISNVLHEGIGIPRLVDFGGNDTLTGGDVGETNAEAERRAREKGLLEARRKGKHHFQSMDEIGETAISWTLGKMVIEASKAVQPRSAAIEAVWTSRLPTLGLDHMEQRLNALGIQTIWAYGFVTFFMVVCIFNYVKRRFRWSWTFFPTPKRGRKPSISGRDSASFSNTGSGWSWPWSRDGYEHTVEDGFDLTPTKSMSARSSLGRFRLWSRRMTNSLKKAQWTHSDRPRAVRHVSMPLTASSYAQGAWASQPPSPRREGGGSFFTPALGIPGTPPDTRSSLNPSPGGSVSTSPPRTLPRGIKTPRTRQNSHNGAKLGVPDNMGNGWNDPPMTMLGADEGTGTLTPTAASAARGYEQSISRQSSRVNLSELGLAQRNMSRAATPSDYDDRRS